MKREQNGSSLRLANEKIKEELRQRTQQLSFFIDIGKALTSTLEFKKVLNIIMEKAQKLIRCEAWALLLMDESSQELYLELAKGKKRRQVKELRLKLGEGVAGWVAKKGKPFILSDVRKEKRFLEGPDVAISQNPRSILCVPIINKRKTIGVLEMINRLDGQPFQRRDLDLLLKLVDQASIAIERSWLYQKMADLAITDDLTKLFNFRYLVQALDNEVRRCQRYGLMVSMIFLDLDYFKTVNDNHGHLMGSQVLIEVGQILLNSLRNVDTVARYGGDEFVVILPETDVETTFRITQRIHETFQKYLFLEKEGLRVQLTASFGIAGFPQHTKDKTGLIRLSDQAMYKAKGMGRNRICMADKEE